MRLATQKVENEQQIQTLSEKYEKDLTDGRESEKLMRADAQNTQNEFDRCRKDLKKEKQGYFQLNKMFSIPKEQVAAIR